MGGLINNHGANGWIEKISGNFLYNKVDYGNYNNSAVLGGLLYNGATYASMGGRSGSASMGDLTGNFEHNEVLGSTIFMYGGLVSNYGGIMGNVTGDFTNNVVTTTNDVLGGFIFNTSSTIGDISGNFKGNKLTGKTVYGIYNQSSQIGNISGNFEGNELTGEKTVYGIYNRTSQIGVISGNFINNTYQGNIVYGGIFNSGGTINQIVGSTFQNNVANGSATAIGAGITNLSTITNGIVNAKFLDNIALSDTDAAGVAIYTTKSLNITANGSIGDGISTFKGNYYQIAGGEKKYEAIYMGSAANTLTLEAKNGGTINLYDYISGSVGYDTVITGDSTGTVNLYNDIKKSDVSIEKVDINTANDILHNYTFNTLTTDNSVNWQIDIDTANSAADTIETANASAGTVLLYTLNLIGSPTEIDKDFKVQILKTQNSDLQLAKSAQSFWDTEYLIDTIGGTTVNDDIEADTSWDKVYYSHITADEFVYGKLQLDTTDTENDSISIAESSRSGGGTEDVSMGDTLMLVNQDESNEVKTFTAPADGAEYSANANMGATKGTLSINGVAGGAEETVDLGNHQGFEVGDGAVALNFNNVTINGENDIATVTNGNASINFNGATINGNMAADTTYSINSDGSTTLNGTAEKANITIRSGTLTTEGENIAEANSVTNNAGLLLSGNLSKTIAGVGTTTVNNSLNLQENANISGTLDLNDGQVTISENEITTHNIVAIEGNGRMSIDADLNGSGSVDTINTSELSSGTITLEKLNLLGEATWDDTQNGFKLQILNNGHEDSALQLALSEALAEELRNAGYVDKVITPAYSYDDAIKADTAWNEQYYHHDVSAETETKVIDLNDAKDAICVEITKTEAVDTKTVYPDTLSLVNQDESNEVKTFTAPADGAEYTANADMGATKGTLSINGVAGGAEETVDLGNHQGFEVGEGAILNLNDVRLVGKADNVINNSGGDLNATASTIDGNIDNSGKFVLTDSTLNGNLKNSGKTDLTRGKIAGKIDNSGVLNLNDGADFGEITGNGIANINTDAELKNTISGNTVNVNNATLSGLNNLQSDVSLNAVGAGIVLDNQSVKLKSANFDANSVLSLAIRSVSDYGNLTADNITVAQGAQMKATLSPGIVSAGKPVLLRLLNANNVNFNNFSDNFDNKMYNFEKVDKSGLYRITLAKTAEDVVREEGGQNWVAIAAKDYIDIAGFGKGTVAAKISDKFADLAQNDVESLISEIKALAPTETAVVQAQVMENADRLFKTVDNYLREERDVLGISSGDRYGRNHINPFENVSIWAKPYIGKAKVENRTNIPGVKSDSHGIIAGLEKKITPAFKVGFGVQYDETDADAYRRDVDIDTTVGFVYGEYKPNRWFINATAYYGQSDYDEKKYAFGSEYMANYGVKSASAAAVSGYQFDYLTPEVGMRYYHIKQDEYTDGAMQNVAKNKAELLRAVAGVRFVRSFGSFRPDVYLGLTYDVMTNKNNTLVNLTNGTGYTVEGKRMPRLGYELNAGISATVADNVEIGVSYMGAYKEKYQEHTGMLKLKYSF